MPALNGSPGLTHISPFGPQPAADLAERLLRGGVEGEVVEPATLKDRRARGRRHALDLEWVQHRMRADLDEGVASARWILLNTVEDHTRVKIRA
jgi:hypothetical protein